MSLLDTAAAGLANNGAATCSTNTTTTLATSNPPDNLSLSDTTTTSTISSSSTTTTTIGTPNLTSTSTNRNPTNHNQSATSTTPSQIPTQFRAPSRNNSNTSTASSSNKGDLSSTISTINSSSFGSSSQYHHHHHHHHHRSQHQLSAKYKQLIGDHNKQFLAACSGASNISSGPISIASSTSTISGTGGGGAGSSSTPIRSFQRATISSVVKTRAFDNNPVLQGLIASSSTTSPSGHNSLSNSQTPSPHSTPVFSRSRSLRMSSSGGVPHRYQRSPTHIPQPQTYYHHQPSHHSYNYRNSSRTPDFNNSFNNQSGDILSSSSILNASSSAATSSDTSDIILQELTNEKLELKESLEFLECERQVLLDTSKELKDTLSNERSQWKKEHDELKKQLADQILLRVKAESQITKNEVELNDLRLQADKYKEDIQQKGKTIEALEKRLDKIQADNEELIAINKELRHMLSERLKFNDKTS